MARRLVTPGTWDAELSCGVPVFHPTEAEFADFAAYVTAIEPLCGAGLAKVVPPAGWTPRRDGYPPSLLHSVKVRQPIEQQFSKHPSHFGAFFQHNVIQTTRTQWSFRNEALQATFRPSAALRRELSALDSASGLGANAADPPPPTPWTPRVKLDAAAAAEAATAPVDVTVRVPVCPLQRTGESDTAFMARRQAYLDELEQQYWNNLTMSTPKYGADMAGSLFDADQPTWNLQRLPNLLDTLPRRLPGVCIPYLYFGMWRATFSWHVEDMDLYSINYLHYGAPKQWYVVPPAYRKALESVACDIFRDEAHMCSQFMRHKTQMLAPSVLAQNGVPFHRVIQEAGQFVITFPAAYHAGFNHGFNCAEAVNFALPQWIPTGRLARTCHCTPDAVWIDMTLFDPPDTMVATEEEVADDDDAPAEGNTDLHTTGADEDAASSSLHAPTDGLDKASGEDAELLLAMLVAHDRSSDLFAYASEPSELHGASGFGVAAELGPATPKRPRPADAADVAAASFSPLGDASAVPHSDDILPSSTVASPLRQGTDDDTNKRARIDGVPFNGSVYV